MRYTAHDAHDILRVSRYATQTAAHRRSVRVTLLPASDVGIDALSSGVEEAIAITMNLAVIDDISQLPPEATVRLPAIASELSQSIAELSSGKRRQCFDLAWRGWPCVQNCR